MDFEPGPREAEVHVQGCMEETLEPRIRGGGMYCNWKAVTLLRSFDTWYHFDLARRRGPSASCALISMSLVMPYSLFDD